jgi:ATP phosphoribosyltransferase regulatory subunit HisZ
LFQKAIVTGRVPGLAEVLRTASKTFSDAENLAVLEYSIKRAPLGNAALAIAVLAPARLDQQEMADLMFRTLDRRKLGSAAALVLSSSTDPEIHDRLSRVADRNGTLASKRAALAIGNLQAEPAGDER